jgi:UDP-N-acetylmuramate--alanine ligase
MAALAEILAAGGALLSGSDVGDHFYTDEILSSIGLEPAVGFDPSHLPAEAQIVIHSAAYRRDQNPELLEAERRGLVVMNYPEALGSLSRRYDSSGIAGVHGKTTTTAMAGSLISALSLPATILAGSAVASFGNRSTKILGDRYFVAETCEYRRHFLSFRPRRIVLTSVESDHQDFYPTYADILAAFVDYACLLPPGGSLIYCADDRGAREAVSLVARRRPDILLIPYGESAQGPYQMLSYRAASGVASFSLAGLDAAFELHVPGKHLALDASAAIALAVCILGDYRGFASKGGKTYVPTAEEVASLSVSLASFSGSKRRSEILGEAGGVLFMDDYGHHPTAIRDTVAGIKAFWPERRLIVDFMSHTYSRTAALFDEFSACLDGADRIVLHKIYPSARETPDPEVSGRKLYEAVRARRGKAKAGGEAEVSYFEEVMDALPELRKELKAGDLFLTMGAGDNFRLGEALLSGLRGRQGK